MCDIDWSKLYQATSRENRPTPGYVFNDIIQNVSYADPRHIPSVAEYLTECVDGDHAHVKLKALFVIKALAYRVPPFCNSMQQHLASVKDATTFTGPPSALFGDEPYRLVREAAEGAMAALTDGEHYHVQYREMSQRIVGFGNFQPSEDTVLADGTVNVGRDIGVKDVALGAVGLLQTGVGAIFGGVKDLLSNPFGTKQGGLGALGTDIDDDEGDAGYDDGDDVPDQDEPQGTTDEDGCYHPSTGSYVPPMVPLAPAEPPAVLPEDQDEVDSIRDLFEEDEPDYWPEEAMQRTMGQDGSSPEDTPDEASFMRVLGMGAQQQPSAESCSGLAEDSDLKQASSHGAQVGGECDPTESEILDILGLSPAGGPDTVPLGKTNTAAPDCDTPAAEEPPNRIAAVETSNRNSAEKLPFFMRPPHAGAASLAESGFIEV